MKKFSIRRQAVGQDTQIAEADTIEDAIEVVCQGTHGDACVVIMDTEKGEYVLPDQKMLRAIYQKSRKSKQ